MKSNNAQPNRLMWQLIVLAALLIIIVFWSWRQMSQAQQAARHSLEDVTHCDSLSHQIRDIQRIDAIAQVLEVNPTDLSGFIESTSTQAQIKPDQLLRIWPQPSRRIAETQYKLKPIQLLLRDVDLQQLSRCLSELTNIEKAPTQLKVTNLRLTAPRDDPAGLRWNADITLAYLIYSPDK